VKSGKVSAQQAQSSKSGPDAAAVLRRAGHTATSVTPSEAFGGGVDNGGELVADVHSSNGARDAAVPGLLRDYGKVIVGEKFTVYSVGMGSTSLPSLRSSAGRSAHEQLTQPR
jgi:hypothetical protein